MKMDDKEKEDSYGENRIEWWWKRKTQSTSISMGCKHKKQEINNDRRN